MSAEVDVERTILDLKRFHEVQGDDELASALGVSRSTISSWRNRGSVPSRYLVARMGNDKSAWSYAPRDWSEEEHAAFKLSLIRSARSGEFDFADYADYLRRGDGVISKMWIGMLQAKREIIQKMEENEGMRARSAMHLIAYWDFHGKAGEDSAPE